MKNRLILWGSLFGAFVVIFSLIAVNYDYLNKKDKQNEKQKMEQRVISEIAPDLHCDDGWSEYKHNVLGIEFCYPNEWGEPNTAYLSNVTHLVDMEGTYAEKNVHYENSLEILFGENKNIRITIFNDNFTGRDEKGIERDWDYNESGSTGDVVNLKMHGDICKYKIGYDYPNGNPSSFLRDIYSDCEGNIRTAFTEDEKSSRYNSYDLRLLSFVKLSNNYFDNALISYKINNVIQINETISTFDEFFTKKKTRHYNNEEIKTKSREDFNKEKNIFEKFVKSIEVFKPVAEEKKEFEEIPGEDTNITTIRKYYWLIMTGDLESAYQMYGSKDNKNFEEFKELYKNAYSIEPFNFSKKEDGNYEFYVNYQDHNSLQEKFHVIMNVSGDIVETVFLEKYLTEVIVFEDMKAYSVRREDRNYLLLNKNGREIIVDEGASEYGEEYKNIGEVKYFHKPHFSSNGDYLIYGMSGWEWYINYVYDIKNEKLIDISASGASGFSFTPDENNFYLCTSAGIASGPGGAVYSVPDFKKKYDLLENDLETEKFMDVNCSYDKEKNVVLFELNGYYGDPISGTERQEDKVRRIEYNINSGEVDYF